MNTEHFENKYIQKHNATMNFSFFPLKLSNKIHFILQKKLQTTYMKYDKEALMCNYDFCSKSSLQTVIFTING